MAEVFKAASGTLVYLHFPVTLYCPDLLPLQCFHWVPIFLQRGGLHMATSHSFSHHFFSPLLGSVPMESPSLWKMKDETPKNRFNRFADTRHNHPWGNKAPMLWPRLTIEMNYYWTLSGYQGAWLPNTSTVFLPPARLDHGALLWWESNQQTVEAPENSKNR